MSTRNTSHLPEVPFSLGHVFPKAPAGALGAFIQRKLANYVEPTREGTPKGVSVGLSRPKYHAALLAGLTTLDLKKIAREVHVSYPLVRKWRTEDPFFDAGYQAAEEFANNEFDVAARLSFRLLARLGDTVHGPEGSEALVKKIQEEKLVGFDDGALYGHTLLLIIDELHVGHFKSLDACFMHLLPNEEPGLSIFDLAGDYLGWTYCLDRVGRAATAKADKRAQATFTQRQRRAASFLNLLIVRALLPRPAHPSLQAFVIEAARVQRELLR